MKKWIICICSVVLAAVLCSCNLFGIFPFNNGVGTDETVKPYWEVVPDELTYSEGYEPVTSAYAYNALPLEGEKQLYHKLLEVCFDISPDRDEDADRYPMPQVKLEDCALTEAQVRTAIKALTDDHPEIFWMTGTLGYYSDDDETIIQPYSKYTPQDVDSRVSAVRSAASEFYATVPDGLSAYEREIMVHDYLIDRVTYDKDVDTVNPESNDPDIYTVYGALVNQKAVCEGYARSFQMLMNGLGVDCVGLMGKSENQMHMWNAVKPDDSWYHMDVTWDDQEETYARHLYCNVSDDLIYDDHELSPMFDEMTDDEINGVTGEYNASVMNLFVPECPNNEMGYYYRETPHLSDYDGEDVKSGMLKCAEDQEEFFVFYVDEALDFQEAVSLLFVNSPQYFFSYLNAVNNTLPDYSIDSSNVGYVTHEKSRIIAVQFHYY